MEFEQDEMCYLFFFFFHFIINCLIVTSDALKLILINKDSPSTEEENYLNEITSLPVDRLLKEPERLDNELNQIQKDMQTTVATNYRSFIQASQCINKLHSNIEILSASLSKLTNSLHPLSTACDNFNLRSTDISTERFFGIFYLIYF